MRNLSVFKSFATAILLASMCACSNNEKESNTLVILHTNDTHSQIEPGSDGLGGVLRRKAAIDSIRNLNENVLLVDAGDAVQGSLFFYLYGGKVEQAVMNIMGVDERILGNHEFDNGIEELANVLAASDAEKISSNYDLENTPLKGMFKPYVIKKYGNKKIGLLGLNLDPQGIIADGNYNGLEFKPIIETANDLAEKLKNEEKVDYVIAITHLGYNPAVQPGDSMLAVNSRNIDLIIGGHSHEVIESGSERNVLKNLDGKNVAVVQTGKWGRKLGKIEIDLGEDLKSGYLPEYELIDIDSRFDNNTDPFLAKNINTYKAGVDSLMTDWIGFSDKALSGKDVELLNFFSDWILARGSELAPNVDFSITNKGGLRSVIPEGQFSKGHIINMMPFRNYITVTDVKGSDLKDVFDVMAKTDGNGVSRNVKVSYDTIGGRQNYKPESILISGKPLDLNQTYRVATIDYLAKGGDYMSGLTKGTVVAKSIQPLYDELISSFVNGKIENSKLEGDSLQRWQIKSNPIKK